MTLTPEWEYLWQRPSRYELHITGLKTNSGQLVSGRDMIRPINNIANCRLMLQRKQAQIENTQFTKILQELILTIELESGSW